MEKRRFGDFAELQRKTEGQWPWILGDLAPELSHALDNAGKHVPCPVHGGRNGFRLFADYARTGGGICNTCGPFPSGFRLLAWLKGWPFRDAVREVRRWVDGEHTRAAVVRQEPPQAKPADLTAARRRVWAVWKELRPIRGTVAERYLNKRGIRSEHIPWTLRFHPGLGYVDENKNHLGTFPALVAPLRDKEGRIVSLHRTFLSPDGAKAAVPEPKKVMTPYKPLRGCAIKLWRANDGILALTEGIETALAVHAVTQLPVWAAYSATLLPNVELPEDIRKVVIFADRDLSEAGQKYAAQAAENFRALGKEVEVCVPASDIPEGAKTVDWLDVLLTQGADGFPPHWRRQAAAGAAFRARQVA
jgi:phage/plasmid primase-like uncharacterized protein